MCLCVGIIHIYPFGTNLTFIFQMAETPLFFNIQSSVMGQMIADTQSNPRLATYLFVV